MQVVLVAPIGDQRLGLLERNALRPVADRLMLRPSGHAHGLVPRSCVSQANATPLPPPCSLRILAASASVDSRAQSRCHSPLRASHVIGTAPACTIRRTAMS